jgi:hypothetical protein
MGDFRCLYLDYRTWQIEAQIKSLQIKSLQIKSLQIKSLQIKSLQIKNLQIENPGDAHAVSDHDRRLLAEAGMAG